MKSLRVNFIAMLLSLGAVGAPWAWSATLKGTVGYHGAPPATAPVSMNKCVDHDAPIVDESVVISAAGGLKNAIVYLENAPAAPSAPNKAAVLDQTNCRYVPHVMAIQVNQPLTVRSADATMHNVHYSPEINPPNNFGMISAGQEATVTFKSAEVIKFTCDVHPWMNAYVAVFDHPYFAVTGDNGAYEIKSIPAGSYTLVCWHERLGKQQQQNITVADNQVAQADFTYKAP